jgi:predicted component of type VI protein secretion system
MKVQLVPLFKLPNESAVVVRVGRFVIGRAADCSLQLENPFVSRHHCELLVRDHRIYVHDLASHNGTYVNNKPITENTQLEDQDILGVATAAYHVTIQATASDASFLSHAATAAAFWIGRLGANKECGGLSSV